MPIGAATTIMFNLSSDKSFCIGSYKSDTGSITSFINTRLFKSVFPSGDFNFLLLSTSMYLPINQ